MKRFEDWPERLFSFLEQPHVFDWVSCNCVFFTADAVEVQTGFDYASAYRHLTTKRGILVKLNREYDGDIIKAATDKLGDPIEVTKAKRGDVVAASVDKMTALGICIGKMSVFTSPDNKGLIYIHTVRCKEAWSIC